MKAADPSDAVGMRASTRIPSRSRGRRPAARSRTTRTTRIPSVCRFASLAAGAPSRRSTLARSGLFGEAHRRASDARRARCSILSRANDPLAPRSPRASSPPPITVSERVERLGLREPIPDRRRATPKLWHCDPLAMARPGGHGGLSRPAVHSSRRALSSGFCLRGADPRLLDSNCSEGLSPDEEICSSSRYCGARVGHPIRGFAPHLDVERRVADESAHRPGPISIASPVTRSFADPLGPSAGRPTQACRVPCDSIRRRCLRCRRTLVRFDVLAQISFATGTSSSASPLTASPNPAARGPWRPGARAFLSIGGGWPISGAQFHSEQPRLFATPAVLIPLDPIADARCSSKRIHQMVDAYVASPPYVSPVSSPPHCTRPN